MAVNTMEKIKQDWESAYLRNSDHAFYNLLEDYLFLLHHPSVGGGE